MNKKNLKYEWTGTAPAAAAVVIASRDAKDVMRKLMAMEKIFVKKQENER